jgi:uncharacterized protein (TIGR00661 family)
MGIDTKKCVFFVQGEGRGHLTQSISLKQIMDGMDMIVSEILVGKSNHNTIPRFYFDKMDVPVTLFDSPNMSAGRNKRGIKHLSSFLRILIRLPRFIFSLFLIHRKIKKHKPDVIMNFYEPMAGLYYFFFRPKIPMICIGHNYLFNHPEYKVPKGNYITRTGLKLWTAIVSAGAKKNLALSLYPFEDCRGKSIFIVPPLLREEVINHPPSEGDYLLVYLLNNGYMDDIIQWHKKNPEITINCFVDKIEIVDCIPFDSTLFFHQINDKKFLAMLGNCKGLICNSGFESICEAMYFNKPVFMVPVKGNYEQFCNSNDAAAAGAGLYDTIFDIDRFLTYVSNYEKDNQEFIKWVNQSHLIILKHIYGELFKDGNVRQLPPLTRANKPIINPF